MAVRAKVTKRKLALSQSQCYNNVDYFIVGPILGAIGCSVLLMIIRKKFPALGLPDIDADI